MQKNNGPINDPCGKPLKISKVSTDAIERFISLSTFLGQYGLSMLNN